MSWNCLGMLTGERRLEDTGRYEGLAARIIGVWTPIFEMDDGELDLDSIALAMDTIAEHYGHAGPALIEWLTLQDVSEIETQYHFWRDWVAEVWKGHPTMLRRARYAAAVLCAAEVAQQAWPWPEMGPSMTDQVSQAVDMIADYVHERDVAFDAMQYVQDWIGANRGLFYVHGETHESCTTELKGRPYVGAEYEKGQVAVFGSVLMDLMEKQGFPYKATVQEWKNRDWIDAPTKGAFTRVVRVRGSASRCIIIDVDRFLADSENRGRKVSKS
jgi:hypothetical protein